MMLSFTAESPVAGTIHFQAYVQQSKSIFPYGWLTQPAKIMFVVSQFSRSNACDAKNRVLQFFQVQAKQTYPAFDQQQNLAIYRYLNCFIDWDLAFNSGI